MRFGKKPSLTTFPELSWNTKAIVFTGDRRSGPVIPSEKSALSVGVLFRPLTTIRL